MSNKKIVIVVILIIIILLLIGLLVYILYKNNTENACRINAINNAITTFESLNESVSSQVNNTTDNNTISINVINSTEENSAVETVQKYNLTDFTIDYSSYEPRETSEKAVYIYYIDYKMDYDGITNIKDVSLGRLLCIEEIDGEYQVTTVGATGV